MKNKVARTQWFCCLTQPPVRNGEYELKKKLDSANKAKIFKMDYMGRYFYYRDSRMSVLASYALHDFCWRGLAEKPKY